jgi:hypothetical protein
MSTTRRDVVQGAALSAGLGVFGTLPNEASAQQDASAPEPQTIEPLTVKRRGTGFHGLDPGRAFPGYTLFAPSGNTNKNVHLVDLAGKVVHRWAMPTRPAYTAI